MPNNAPDHAISLPGGERGGRIAAVLADRYGLRSCALTYLPIGQGTINFRAVRHDGREVFVKNYPPGTDLAAERAGIGLSMRALRAGIPAAPVLPNTDGEVLDSSTDLPVSVWQWMPGQVALRMSPAQLGAAGTELGRIHALFAELPATSTRAVEQWRTVDVDGLAVTIDHLLDIIAARIRDGAADAFDLQAQRTLRDRHDVLNSIPALLAELPDNLTVQVLHGDFSPVNLLFTGEALSAVLDFRPPDPPFLLAYDLGRVAFYPNTVATDPAWPQAAAALISAYRQANPDVPDLDIRACGRVALLQLLTSLYGVRQHYLKPGLFQDDLDEFWLLRQRTASVLLSDLAITDALLSDVTSR